MAKVIVKQSNVLCFPNEPETELQNLKTEISISVEKTNESPNDWIGINYNGYELVIPRVNWDILKNKTDESLLILDKKLKRTRS